MFDCFAFAEFFDFAAFELDSGWAGFEGLDEAFVALGFIGGGGEKEGGEEKEGEEEEDEGKALHGHDGNDEDGEKMALVVVLGAAKGGSRGRPGEGTGDCLCCVCVRKAGNGKG